MPDIALVGLGGAGTMIVQRTLEDSRIHALASIYIINAENWLNNVRFYRFEQADNLIKELSRYKHVILTAGLGSSGGDSLVYLANRLDNVAAIFATKPFRVEKKRVKKAERQLGLLKGHVITKDLNELLVRMPDVPVGEALDSFDRELAAEVIDKIVELS
jgi:cell division GTPase FtsZ